MFLYYPYFICLLANIEICFSQNHRAMGKSKKIVSQFPTKVKRVQKICKELKEVQNHRGAFE